MFVYEKKLQYPVKIANVNPQLASIITGYCSFFSYTNMAQSSCS